jgi:hypothetical protein
MSEPSTAHLPIAAVPGLTDIAGLCGALAQIPDLAGECADDDEMNALCEVEERTMRALAAARTGTIRDLVRKAEVLVDRLAADGADAELLGAEAALLRSMLRDLRAFERTTPEPPAMRPPPRAAANQACA